MKTLTYILLKEFGPVIKRVYPLMKGATLIIIRVALITTGNTSLTVCIYTIDSVSAPIIIRVSCLHERATLLGEAVFLITAGAAPLVKRAMPATERAPPASG